MIIKPIEEKIETLIAPAMEAQGFCIVRVKFFEKGGNILQVMAERMDGKGITLDNCADISHLISPILDVEDVIKNGYSLEVSSPGMERPLVRLNDFERFKGKMVKIALTEMINNKRNYQGMIIGIKGDNVILDAESLRHEIPFSLIHSAKLILSEEEFFKKEEVL